MEKLVYRIEEAAEAMSLGRTAMYQAVKRNQIPHVVVGGLKLIPRAALEKMLAECKCGKEDKA